MRRLIKKGLLVLLILSLLLNLTACNLQEYIAYFSYRSDPAAYVVFFRDTEPEETTVPVTEVMEYTSQYADCNGTWFRDCLEGEDLCIYNAYLYAMEHNFIAFELYVEDSGKDFFHIREALSLDSPFMAQNYDQSEHISAYSADQFGEKIRVFVEQFTEDRWEKNLEALEACRQIVAGIPDTCVTQEEQMEYLYRYVCDHVEYVTYEQYGEDDYLYDAVIKGETFCDGYSNMLNLLFNLTGIECCEAMGSDIENYDELTQEEAEENPGHTWVVAKLDGVFYNFDPTFDDTDERDDDIFCYFGFSDALISTKYLDLDETRPKCTDTSRDFYYADLVVSDITSDDTAKSIADMTEAQVKEGRYTTLVVVSAAVDEASCDVFFDNYWQYTTTITYINIRYSPYEIEPYMFLEITVEQ